MEHRRQFAIGLACGLGAYLLWGVLPLYFRLIGSVPAFDIVAHRVVWALLFFGILLTAQGKWSEVVIALRSRTALLWLLGSTLFLAINWLTFTWAIEHRHVVEVSLGYFTNPLVNVALGFVFLKERLRSMQTVSIAIATIAVGLLAVFAPTFPFIALTLAFTFGFFGLLRKMSPTGPLVGLAIETALLLPAAVIYLPLASRFEVLNPTLILFLVLSGPVTGIPLLLFANAARRLPLTMMGFLQYLAPTLQFLIAVLVFREPFTWQQQVSFSLIWLALLIFTIDSIRYYRRPPVAIDI